MLTKMTFIEKVHEDGDIYTFKFKPGKKLKHRAGQHGVFLTTKLTRPYPFSLVSTPDDDHVAFSTHVGSGSRFKNLITQLEFGDKIYMFGPIRKFFIDPSIKNHVFLAQGIGITPFVSMLRDASDKKLPVKSTLVHVQDDPHTFKKLTKKHASRSYYPTNPDEFIAAVEEQDKNNKFYISGSPRFIRSIKRLLGDMGVKRSNVKADSFWGY